MKKLSTLIGMILLTAGMMVAYASVPKLLSYQGRLTDSGGNPVTGAYDMVFSIYASAAGGTALWTETQISVPVTNGLFSTLLGSVTPLDLAFDTDYYLGIQVGSDVEMTPRQPLTSCGYAINADMLDGQHVTELPYVKTITAGSNVIVSSTSTGDYTISATSGAGSTQWVTNGNGVYYCCGNVGIGTTATTQLNTAYPNNTTLEINDSSRIGGQQTDLNLVKTRTGPPSNEGAIGFINFVNPGSTNADKRIAAISGSNAGTVNNGHIRFFTNDGNADSGRTSGFQARMEIESNGYVGIGTLLPTSVLHVVGLPVYGNNSAAVAAGLTAGAFYRDGGDPDHVCVVH